MLGWRIGISVFLVPSLLGLFWWDSQLGNSATVLLVLALLLAIRSCYEMCYLLKTRAMKPVFEVCAACSVLVILLTWARVRLVEGIPEHVHLLVSLGCVAAGLFASFVILLLVEAVRYRKPGSSMESLGAGLLAVVYAAGLLAVLIQFRWYPSPEIGYFAVGSVIIAVKSGDIMAYTFGRLWGRRKMVPTLSPGKTWMGGVGAIVGACVGSWLWLTFGGGLFEASPKAAGLVPVLASRHSEAM